MSNIKQDNPLVSVLCITYNHALYIENMLEGLLNQKTTFDVEYIIHDDQSIDGTQKILERYESKYPGFFHMMYEEENQTKKGVKIFQQIMLPKARGKYIAICEGDDCWIDSHKLQEQIDFLENNPDYVCVAHNAIKIDGNNCIPFNMYSSSREVVPEDIIYRHFPYLPTSSKVFRRDAFELSGIYLNSGFIGDVATEFHAITKGRIFYIDKIMSVYRFGIKGSYTVMMSKWWEIDFKNRLYFYEFLKKFNRETGEKYKYPISLYMSTTADDFIPKVYNSKISRGEFLSAVEKIKSETVSCNMHWADELVRVINIFVYNREEMYAKKVLDRSRKGKIYIYGAGDFGLKLGNWLLNENVDFEGYLVSAIGKQDDRCLGKPVYEIDSIKKSLNSDDLILVGVDAEKCDGIIKKLKEEQIDNYMCPANIEP